MNELIYIPYINSIGSGPFSNSERKKYFGAARCTTVKDNMFSPKDSLELGALRFLLEEIKKKGKNKDIDTELRMFIEQQYPNVDCDRLLDMAKDLKDVSERRNNAAHPNIIDYDVAEEDKSIIYVGNVSYSEAIQWHDLFNNLLDIVFG